ncbi:hypothetical protein KR200_009623 [Drosophila serrata]|nr:hypothetical protein KR200_009623 [Drosophila serrata]
MSSRKPGGGAGGAATATATLEDNASVENPASSEESSTGVGEEVAISPSAKPSSSPTPTHVEAAATGDAEVNKDQDAKDTKDAKESSPAPKTLTATISSTTTTRRTPTPTLTPTSDGVAIKSVRITRHSSPLLLLSSPTTSRREVSGSDAAGATLDGEESSTQGGQTKSSVERSLAPVIRGRKSIKDLKEAKEVKSEEATAELPLKEEPLAEGSESHESKPATDEKDHKDIKDKDKEKEKEKEPVTPTTCNRVTRKSHAQEQANNTRITRNRRQSSTVGAITSGVFSSAATEQPPPQLPARGRRKRPVAAVVPATKRKRSEDADSVVDPEASNSAKYSKVVVVVKTEDIGDADEDAAGVLAGAIKQEPMDATEVGSIPSPAVTPTPTPAPAPAPSGRRGRGRPQNRNSTSPATPTAATTRATRLSKAGSPGIVAQEPAPPKRRRVGSSTRKTASASSLAPSSQGGAGDEDSKDSMASSMDDLLLAAADIKQEKLTPDFDESLLTESLPSTSAASIASISSANGHSSSCIEPLTVDTESTSTTSINKPADSTAASATKVKESPTSESSAAAAAAAAGASSNESPSPSKPAAAPGKAPSLSPEMISEGVSAVSVRKFYKKPEFLENNLGIEKDPELGEIVQTVSGSSSSSNAVEAETDVETAPCDGDVAMTMPAELPSPQPKTEVEAEKSSNEESVEQKAQETEAEADEAVPEPTTDDVTTEITHEEEIEGELEVSSHSNTSLKAGQLRLDDSTEGGGDEVLLENEEEGNGGLLVNGDEAPADESVEKLVQLEDEEEPETQRKPEDYDDFENEIMEELAKEGVLDASGNALSQQVATASDVTLAEAKSDGSDPSPVDEMVAMEVDESYIDMKQQAEQLLADHLACADATDADDCCPEENKENLSTSPADADIGGAAEGLVVVDIPLTLKEEDKEEEKPLTVMATEQKQDLPPFKLALQLDLEKDEKANGKKEEESLDGIVDEQQQQLRREQEIHLHNLGLLTHQAAEQRRQDLQEAHTRQAQLHQKQQQHYHQHGHQHLHHHQQHKRQGARGGGGGPSGGSSATHVESSGTLKTVIKLNRSSNGGMGGSGGLPTGTVIHGGGGGSSSASSTSSSSVGSATRKSSGVLGSGAGAGAGAVAGVRRQSLKMTFQKGRARGHGAADRSADQHGAHAEDSYYTIQNENEGATKSSVTTGNPGRKSNNRFSSTNNHHSAVASTHGNHSHSAVQYNSSHSEGQGQTEHGFYQMVKKDEKEKILIPEKASSFKFHPGRLCEDQCYYCSGKFGLYDTPCHVGQIKSVERQQKILANEEKLTVDNCLCDACFRHVDRRANAPSYKKRLSAPGHLETGVGNAAMEKHFAGEHGVIPEGAGDAMGTGAGAGTSGGGQHRACAVKDCVEGAGHSLRRKFIRKSLKKFQLNLEIPAGTSNVWLCEVHYNTVIQFSGCVLCKRRLGRNHMYNITTQDTDRLEKALAEMGIPVQLGMGTAVCKLCRYFANLLMKPPDSTKSQKAEFVKNYRKRLLKVHNLQDGSHEVSEADEEEAPSAAKAERGGPAGGHEDTELPMVVDDDGHTDSNSSSSSMTPLDSSKQMSKLQAILQQNLGTGDATTTGLATADAAAGSGGGGGGAASGSGTGSGADISNVLRGNPNISMRELFHGEEELGVQFKVPFGCSSSQRTPEGWTRVQTFLQYDEPTRRLWEELQKPYGNQSSFLRHLILLEKYYRNGDLVLAAHASSNATVYTETVRQRLNSFDHGHCGGLGNMSSSGTGSSSASASASSSSKRSGIPQPTSGSVLATALTTPYATSSAAAAAAAAAAASSADQPLSTDPVIPLVELNDDDEDDEDGVGGEDGTAAPTGLEDSETEAVTPLDRLRAVSVDKLTKQLSSNAVTIIARPKDKSLLASSNATTSSTTSSSSSSSSAAASPPEEEVIAKATVTVNTAAAAAAAPAQSKDAPPLVLVGGNSRSILKSNLLGMNKAAVEIVPLSSQGVNAGSGASAASQKVSSVAQLLSSPPELISLQRRRTSGAAAGASTSNSLLGNLHGKRLQLPRIPAAGTSAGTSAGGRGAVGVGATAEATPPPNVVKLPDTLTPQERHESKNWKPTLIPLEDQVPNKSHALYQTADGRRLPALVQVQSGGKPYLISIFDYNRMCILRREKLLRDQMLKANAKQKPSDQQHAQTQQQQQQQQQQQGNPSAEANFSRMVKVARHLAARGVIQQLQQRQQQQQQHQQQHLPTLQPGGVAATGGEASRPPVRLARIAPKPMPPLTNPQIGSQAPLDNSNNSWLWKNFPDPNQYLLNGNGGGVGSAGNSASKLPHLTAKPATATSSGGGGGGAAGGGNNIHKSGSGGLYPIKLHQLQHSQQHQQKLIDNAIMSKIPKSLTVIPQGGAGGGGGSSGSNTLGELGGGGTSGKD